MDGRVRPGEADGHRPRARHRALPARHHLVHDRPTARQAPRPPLVLLPGQATTTKIPPVLLDDWTGRWVAQLAAPSAERLGGGEIQGLSDVATGSLAYIGVDEKERAQVTQRGPIPLWDQVTDALAEWKAAGAPPPVRLRHHDHARGADGMDRERRRTLVAAAGMTEDPHIPRAGPLPSPNRRGMRRATSLRLECSPVPGQPLISPRPLAIRPRQTDDQ